MTSVEIPVLRGRYLTEVFKSIRAQTFKDYEAVIVNSLQKGEVLDLIGQYGFKEVRENTKLLKARYLAHKESRGDYELLVDRTRVLRKDALEILSLLNHGMAIIGDSLWVKLMKLDMENIVECNMPDALHCRDC